MSGSNNIQALREARGWSRPELGKRMGTSGQQVERLEKGQRRLAHDWIEKAARALEVSSGAIITTNYDQLFADAGGLPTLRAADANAVELRQVDLAYSMGPGSNIEDYPDEGALQFDANLLSTITRSPPERLFVARGAGDSMFPTLLNDDMVVIDSLQRTLNLQDRIWAISLHGAGGIKRLRTIGKGRVLVISDNKDVENQEADAEDLFIAGRVIWVGRRI